MLTLDEKEKRAKELVTEENPNMQRFEVSKAYENFMDGTLVTVSFWDQADKKDHNHVHFDRDGVPRIYRWHTDVMTAVSHYKERIWFFRFLEFAGMGGFIAVILVLVFSALLAGLALSNPTNTSIVEIVKLSFTTILGYFFGSQAANRPAK